MNRYRIGALGALLYLGWLSLALGASDMPSLEMWKDTRYWLENMIVDHGYSLDEAAAGLGLPRAEIDRLVKIWAIGPAKPTPAGTAPVDGSRAQKSTAPPDPRVKIRPWAPGRHPRIGFLDGAINPQRDTKVSIFLPWAGGGFVVLDLPEAVFSNLGLLYLAHTHIPTIWEKDKIELEPIDWTRNADGSLESRRELPNRIRFGAKIRPRIGGADYTYWIENGTGERLTGLRNQLCLLLKNAPEFNDQSADNKILMDYPDMAAAAARSRDGKRFIVTACERAKTWQNPPCPCMHADPTLPDLEPGARAEVRGRVFFWEGEDVRAEIERRRGAGDLCGDGPIGDAMVFPEDQSYGRISEMDAIATPDSKWIEVGQAQGITRPKPGKVYRVILRPSPDKPSSPSELHFGPSVTEIDVEGDLASDELLARACEATSLSSLMFSGRNVSAFGLSQLARLTSLKRLSIYELNANAIPALRSLAGAHIRDLTISGANLTSYTDFVSSFHGLQVLALDGCQLPSTLLGLAESHISELTISGSDLTVYADLFSSLHSLQVLTLWNCGLPSDMEHEVGQLGDLKSVRISNCQPLTHEALQALLRLPKLDHLAVGGCGLSGLADLSYPAESALQSVYLGSNPITSQDIIPLLSHIPNVRSLHLGRTLVDPGIIAPLSKLQNLEELDLLRTPLSEAAPYDELAILIGLRHLSLTVPRDRDMTPESVDRTNRAYETMRSQLKKCEIYLEYIEG